MKKILIIFVLMTYSCGHVNTELSDKLQKKCSHQSNNFIKIEREKAVFRVVKESNNYTLTQYYR